MIHGVHIELEPQRKANIGNKAEMLVQEFRSGTQKEWAGWFGHIHILPNMMEHMGRLRLIQQEDDPTAVNCWYEIPQDFMQGPFMWIPKELQAEVLEILNRTVQDYADMGMLETMVSARTKVTAVTLQVGTTQLRSHEDTLIAMGAPSLLEMTKFRLGLPAI